MPRIIPLEILLVVGLGLVYGTINSRSMTFKFGKHEL